MRRRETWYQAAEARGSFERRESQHVVTAWIAATTIRRRASASD
jgi:hypothetical protein